MARQCSVAKCQRNATRKGWCGMHYQRWTAHGDVDWPQEWWRGQPVPTRCEIDGCNRPPRQGRVPICEVHYYRHRRTGRYTDPVIIGRKSASTGYMLVLRRGHPLARRDGWAYEHRVILYAEIGGGSHACHWCSRIVTWDRTYPRSLDALVVDHINGNKQDNDSANLVPACAPCNVGRVHSARTNDVPTPKRPPTGPR